MGNGTQHTEQLMSFANDAMKDTHSNLAIVTSLAQSDRSRAMATETSALSESVETSAVRATGDVQSNV